MCHACDDPTHLAGPAEPDRRRFLMAGTGLAAVPLIPGAAIPTMAQEAEAGAPFAALFETRAYGVTGAQSPVEPMPIQRRAVGPGDVLIDILYCGICHSDIHQVRNEWPNSQPTRWPSVPGHEITGRVAAVGSAVTRFRVGDNCGVGCMVNADLTCDACRADLEQHCESGATFTYNSPDPVLGGHTYGGWSEHIVVPEHFVLRIAPGADLAATAPLLCAGLTTFSPLQRWEVGPGQRIGVVGLGGLGHMALKLGVARGADVTVFTTSPGKVEDARRMGASRVILSTDAEAMAGAAGQLDLVIATVPQAYPVGDYLAVLRTGGTLVNVGALVEVQFDAAALVFARKSVAGSLIGGVAETQQVVDDCAARGIAPEVEVIRPDQINEAMDRVVGREARYRFVIDTTAGRA